MAEIHLTDVPGDIWQSLVNGARRRGTTLEEEILARLARPPFDPRGQEIADMIEDGHMERDRRILGLGEDSLDEEPPWFMDLPSRE